MNLKHLLTSFTLLLTLHLILIAESADPPFNYLNSFISTPATIDDAYLLNYQNRPVSQSNSLLSRLKQGYYYIGNGIITPISLTDVEQNNRRRQDIGKSYDTIESYNTANVKYTPLVRYNRTNRKKLFVPNLFG